MTIMTRQSSTLCTAYMKRRRRTQFLQRHSGVFARGPRAFQSVSGSQIPRVTRNVQRSLWNRPPTIRTQSMRFVELTPEWLQQAACTSFGVGPSCRKRSSPWSAKFHWNAAARPTVIRLCSDSPGAAPLRLVSAVSAARPAQPIPAPIRTEARCPVLGRATPHPQW
jgi:hypothetical protein